jgi:C4-dicarboxylate-binding protein DctP
MTFSRIISATCLSAALALAASGAVSAQEHVMKISAPIPPTEKDVVYAWMLAFEKGVEERTDGQIDVQLYPANQLGQLPAAVEGTAMGTIEAAFSIIGFFSMLDNRFQVLDAGGLFETSEQAMRTFQQPEVREMLSGFGEGAGVQPLTVLIDGQGVIISKEPIETVADFAGKKVRVGGTTPLVTEPLVAVGAAPVAMALGEVMPSLQTGTIDAATNSMAVVNAFKMADVAKNVTYLPGNYTTVGAIVNKAFLERIGPEFAAIVMEEAQKAESVFDEHVKRVGEHEAAWEAAGGRVITLSDEETQKYLDTINPVVAGIVARDEQMQSDYDVLKEAAAAAAR